MRVDRRARPSVVLLAIAVALVATLAGCVTPGARPPSDPVDKSVVSVEGVRHGPILIAPDQVVAGGTLVGRVEAQTRAVLVQAVLEPGARPIGEVPLEAPVGRAMTFTLAVPPDARGRLLVRAIDTHHLYTDRTVAVVEPSSRN